MPQISLGIAPWILRRRSSLHLSWKVKSFRWQRKAVDNILWWYFSKWRFVFMSSMELESKVVFVFCTAPGLLTEGWSSLSQHRHRHHYWLVITIAVKTLLQNRRLRWGLPSREVFPWDRPACRPAWHTSSGSASSSTSRSMMSSSRSAQWCLS